MEYFGKLNYLSSFSNDRLKIVSLVLASIREKVEVNWNIWIESNVNEE